VLVLIDDQIFNYVSMGEKWLGSKRRLIELKELTTP